MKNKFLTPAKETFGRLFLGGDGFFYVFILLGLIFFPFITICFFALFFIIFYFDEILVCR